MGSQVYSVTALKHLAHWHRATTLCCMSGTWGTRLSLSGRVLMSACFCLLLSGSQDGSCAGCSRGAAQADSDGDWTWPVLCWQPKGTHQAAALARCCRYACAACSAPGDVFAPSAFLALKSTTCHVALLEALCLAPSADAERSGLQQLHSECTCWPVLQRWCSSAYPAQPLQGQSASLC